MPDTPLNPDALEAAYIAVSDESWLSARAAREVASAAVSAYLAVAQPELRANSKPKQNLEFVNILETLEAHQRSFRNGRCSCEEYGPKRSDKEHNVHVAEVLEKHMQEREAQMRQLIRDMTDPGACWFDHHGGCQEHGYLELKPGELCPHAEAKQLLGDEPNGH